MLLSLKCISGEIEEMEHENEDQESKEKVLDTNVCQPEDCVQDDLGKEGLRHRKYLFSFSLVNSYGTSEINSITTDGKILKLNCKYTL